MIIRPQIYYNFAELPKVFPKTFGHVTNCSYFCNVVSCADTCNRGFPIMIVNPTEQGERNYFQFSRCSA